MGREREWMLSLIMQDQLKTNCAVLFSVWEKNNSRTDRRLSARRSLGAEFIGGFDDQNLLVVFHLPYAILLAGRFERPSPIFIPDRPCS